MGWGDGVEERNLRDETNKKIIVKKKRGESEHGQDKSATKVYFACLLDASTDPTPKRKSVAYVQLGLDSVQLIIASMNYFIIFIFVQ